MIKISELKTVLEHIIKNNNYLESIGHKKNSLLIESEAGIGKTSVVEQVALENDLNFVKLNLSNIEELGDLVGFPIREFETEEGVWINEKHLDVIKDVKLTGKTRMGYCPPFWLPQEADKGGILLLDDYSRADARFMQACMELTDRQTYISWKLPEKWHVILTSNPDNGNYFVTAMDIAQKTRYTKVHVKFDVDEWAKWAESYGVDSRCINFLLLNPELIKEDADHPVNARSATEFFANISSIENFSNNYDLITLLGEGSVGVEFTTSFILFLNNKLDKLPHPLFLINEPKDDEVLKALKSCVGSHEKETYKTNIASVLCTRLINTVETLKKTKKYKKQMGKRLSNIIKSQIFSGDHNYHLYSQLNSLRVDDLATDVDLITEVA